MHQQIAANAYHAVAANDADGIRLALKDSYYMQEQVEGANLEAFATIDRACWLALRTINGALGRNRDAVAIDIEAALSALARVTRS